MSERSVEPSCEPVQPEGLLGVDIVAPQSPEVENTHQSFESGDAQQNLGIDATHQSRERQRVVSWLRFSLLLQLFRFGVVGLTAATVHYFIVVALVQAFSYEPLIANIFAFLVSFQVSYFGHRRFTFNGTTINHAVALPRLLMLQMFNFVANESLFYLLLSLHLPYQAALLIVLVTLPLFTFTVSKRWVFRY